MSEYATAAHAIVFRCCRICYLNNIVRLAVAVMSMNANGWLKLSTLPYSNRIMQTNILIV